MSGGREAASDPISSTASNRRGGAECPSPNHSIAHRRKQRKRRQAKSAGANVSNADESPDGERRLSFRKPISHPARPLFALLAPVLTACLRLALVAAGLLFATSSALAEAPKLNHLIPAGAARGSTNTVTLTGKFEPWPPRVWVHPPGVIFVAGTNQGKLRVEVAPDAPPGPRLVRLYNNDGASEPRFFVVGAGREIADVEPNDHFARPQPAGELPVTINGQLEKEGSVDSFAVNVRAGQWLDARLDAYAMKSGLDGVLRLVTTNGQQLALNHDFASLDPRLVWRSPATQTLVVQVFGFPFPFGSEVRLQGGDEVVYRLHLTASDEAPADHGAPATENEPNNASTNAPLCELPATILGASDPPGDEDRFQFTASTNEFIDARLEGESIGSPLDAWLAIEDASGKELVRNDDTGESRDPRLEWKPVTNGTFLVAVGSITRQGGSDFRYRLTLRRAGPDYSASLPASSLVIWPGSTNEVKLTVARLRGLTNVLSASIRDLPSGVSAAPTNAASNVSELSIKVEVATNAAPFSGPMRVVVGDPVTQQERTAQVKLTVASDGKGEAITYTRLLIEQTDQYWLTVRTNSPEPAKVAEKK